MPYETCMASRTARRRALASVAERGAAGRFDERAGLSRAGKNCRAIDSDTLVVARLQVGCRCVILAGSFVRSEEQDARRNFRRGSIPHARNVGRGDGGGNVGECGRCGDRLELARLLAELNR